MAVYFGTTEITNFDNLVPSAGQDITDIWFGTTNVYTVWQIYEGTLPATFNANGADMRQYQIYGNTGGVGDKTANLYLFNANSIAIGRYIDSDGNEQTSAVAIDSGIRLNHTDYFSIIENQTYVFSGEHGYMTAQQRVAFIWYDINKTFISRTATMVQRALTGKYTFSGVAPSNAEFAIVNFFTNRYASCMIVQGTTAPATYIPYGYEVDMSASDGTNTTTPPIYIGDSALQKDEYVDYKTQKIYRKVNDVLTPTDPPVALPALPTCEGTTIVDYAGQSVAVPEKAVLEYRKENF